MPAKRPFKLPNYQQDPRGPGSPHAWRTAFRVRLGLDAAKAEVHESGSTPRAILGVGKDATWKEIQKAYRQLALQHHPDRQGDPALFRRVTGAYEVLEYEFGLG